MSISYIDHPHDAAIRRTNAVKLLNKVKSRKVSGRFVKVPDMPKTWIFVRSGRNEAEFVKSFVDRYNSTHAENLRGVAV